MLDSAERHGDGPGRRAVYFEDRGSQLICGCQEFNDTVDIRYSVLSSSRYTSGHMPCPCSIGLQRSCPDDKASFFSFLSDDLASHLIALAQCLMNLILCC